MRKYIIELVEISSAKVLLFAETEGDAIRMAYGRYYDDMLHFDGTKMEFKSIEIVDPDTEVG